MSNSPPDEPALTLDAINTGVAVVEAKEVPDSQDFLESENLETIRLQNRLRRSQIKNVKADRKMRKEYASRILRYLEFYSAAVALMVVAAGIDGIGFDLPEVVQASLVGSTAVAAIGLVGFIARGLFRPPEG